MRKVERGGVILPESKARVASINQVLRRINHRAGGLYDFIMIVGGLLNNVEINSHGQRLTMLEMRIIMLVNDYPGITAAEICKRWSRTRGALSQMLKKIEEKGFIYREKNDTGSRAMGLYVTDQGVETINEYTIRDFQDDTHIVGYLLEECSEEELRAFYKVIKCYCGVLQEHPETHWKGY